MSQCLQRKPPVSHIQASRLSASEATTIAASSTVMSPSISHDKPRRAMRHRWFHIHKDIPVHAVVAHSPRVRIHNLGFRDDDSNNASDSVADWLSGTWLKGHAVSLPLRHIYWVAAGISYRDSYR
ncbi:hypothetical protein HO173_001903 [Letharia columbiana]|uniref:Uncharacterized protein n=1 Tax=Letharia columbiana TaxID=112416 RepID=A0A8H6G4J1_9LECA|nr:uncharacterized protein HO173_001903 [Letharia columbiana]KAF6240292.1 hypothetical protein HO173_001903 [Letharia columbiana]